MFRYDDKRDWLTDAELAQATRDLQMTVRTKTWALRLLKEVEKLRADQQQHKCQPELERVGPF
jgi:hypothetical protein